MDQRQAPADQEQMLAQLFHMFQNLAQRITAVEQRLPPSPGPAPIPMATAAPVEHQEDARRPRHTQKDPEKYDDLDRSKFMSFYIGLIAKLRIDREAIGFPSNRIWYAYELLKDDAHDKAYPSMLLHGNDPNATEETLQAVLNHLKKLFEDCHAAEEASLQFVQLKQLNKSFRDYITEFDRLMRFLLVESTSLIVIR